MPGVVFNGPSGRLEGNYHRASDPESPIALILHPHPRFGGTMHTHVVRGLFYLLTQQGFTVLRFNFRGVGRSEGVFNNGAGELSDAEAALDWLQSHHGNASKCWILGHSFGAWIGMNLLMRRPEITGFVSVALPANLYDFGFLAPCPSSGLIMHGDKDKIVPSQAIRALVQRLKSQKGIEITYKVIKGANHTFEGHLERVRKIVGHYIKSEIKKS